MLSPFALTRGALLGSSLEGSLRSVRVLCNDSLGNIFEVKGAAIKALVVKIVLYLFDDFDNDFARVGLGVEVLLNDAVHALDEELELVLAILGRQVKILDSVSLFSHDARNEGINVGAWGKFHAAERILEDGLHDLVSVRHVGFLLLDCVDVLLKVSWDKVSLSVTNEAPVFGGGALRELAGGNGRDDVVVDHLDDDGRDDVMDEVLLVLRLGLGERNRLDLGLRVLVVHDAGKDHVHVENDVTHRLGSVDVDLGKGRRGDVRAAGLGARRHARLGVAAAGTSLCSAGLGEVQGRRSTALHGESVGNGEERAGSGEFEHCSDRFCDYYIADSRSPFI